MKKCCMFIVSAVATLSFLTTGVSAEEVTTKPIPTGQYGANTEIQQKLKEIANKYEVNEQLNKEDAEYVRQHADPIVKPNPSVEQTLKSKKVSGSKSNSKISATISGTITNNIGVINNSFGGNVTTKVTKGSPSSIDTRIRVVSYGLIGSGGIGKVQDKTLHSVCKNTKTCNNSQTHRYTASVAYSTTYAEGIIKYTGGSLTVEAN